ncbi:hypothetical protein CHS0354_011316 [Potamilus streckersoni]|uniref:Uncharacterized protein n=1 Tax=Potamilus streckersoni TaxID=2493646 RepID=A0AAE0S9K6_9BIVA|nr:hypothetical protein CHS0354_011316 [Potamilus streckersoni]
MCFAKPAANVTNDLEAPNPQPTLEAPAVEPAKVFIERSTPNYDTTASNIACLCSNHRPVVAIGADDLKTLHTPAIADVQTRLKKVYEQWLRLASGYV